MIEIEWVEVQNSLQSNGVDNCRQSNEMLTPCQHSLPQALRFTSETS